MVLLVAPRRIPLLLLLLIPLLLVLIPLLLVLVLLLMPLLPVTRAVLQPRQASRYQQPLSLARQLRPAHPLNRGSLDHPPVPTPFGGL